MYLFLHHICFYSNIFGYETKVITNKWSEDSFIMYPFFGCLIALADNELIYVVHKYCQIIILTDTILEDSCYHLTRVLALTSYKDTLPSKDLFEKCIGSYVSILFFEFAMKFLLLCSITNSMSTMFCKSAFIFCSVSVL